MAKRFTQWIFSWPRSVEKECCEAVRRANIESSSDWRHGAAARPSDRLWSHYRLADGLGNLFRWASDRKFSADGALEVGSAAVRGGHDLLKLFALHQQLLLCD
jgi:hypothetical protein